METKLSRLLRAGEQLQLVKIVDGIAREFPDVIGVLAVGSLVHAEVSNDFYTPRHHTPYGLAYERIRNPSRRRLSIGEGSDLDIWICLRDTKASKAARQQIELGAIALLGELVSGTIAWGSLRWHNKKQAVFGPYYKQLGLYSGEFVAANGGAKPWLARRFKSLLEQRLIECLPDFVERVNREFNKKIPGDFLEIRAFPESLFHLRPDDTVMPNMREDRMPFPRIANDQWISPKHSSLVLYAAESVAIYPFKKDGMILGMRLAEYMGADLAFDSGKSHGALVIKPDAILKGQTGIIMSKVDLALRSVNGRIVMEKRLKAVGEGDIERMYPLLAGRELQEAKEYLLGGEMIVLIIESDQSAPTLFRDINRIKGLRLIDRPHERLLEGRILNGSIRDLLPVPGEEERYKALLPKIFAKKADPSIRFSDEEYRFYAQNLVHSPDNEVELQGLLRLIDFPGVNNS